MSIDEIKSRREILFSIFLICVDINIAALRTVI